MTPYSGPVLYNGVTLPGRPDLDNVFKIDRGAVPMITDMMENGILLDPKPLDELGVRLRSEMEELQADITRLSGYAINPASADQVADLLFKKLKLPNQYVKLTPSGDRESVIRQVLEMLVTHHDCIRPILDWKHRDKLRSTYQEPLPGYRANDGRIHCKLGMTTVPTGRLNSSDPNLQNIPARTSLGKLIRNAFVAPKRKKLVAIDYSQIEMRVIASESKDRVMSEVFWLGDDIHWRTTEGIFRKPRAELSEFTHRKPCKNLGFGVLYGISARGLRDQIVASGGDREFWTEDQCQELIDDWFRLYSGVRDRVERYHYWARKYGFVWDMFGRVRWVPGAQAYSGWVVGKALRECGNHPIQAGAQGILKLAMAELWDLYKDAKDVVRFVMQVHDELLIEVAEEAVDYVVPEIAQVMRDAVPLRVPVEVGVKVGDCWGEMETFELEEAA